METTGEKLRAFALALGLHVACILALLVGLWWTHDTRPVVMPGQVIEATLVGPTAAPKSRPAAAKPAPAKPEPPKPEPPKPEPPKPEPPAPPPQAEAPSEVQRQDTIERERIAALAVQKAETEKREQEERQRQKQVLLEQEKERKQAEERQKQIKELADIRAQREAAEKKLNIEKQRLAQLEDRQRADKAKAEQAQPQTEHEAPQAQTGAGGRDDDLTARYSAAIQAAVTNSWNRPDSAQGGLRCTLRIIQIPGGEVLSAQVTSPCNADQATRNSIEQAVMKAAPLPYQGYEKVFQRDINFNFKFEG